MIIVWGVKERRRHVGHVAELCPSCNAVAEHRLVQVRETPHIYYVGVGPGKIAGYQAECSTCKGRQDTDPARYAARLDKPIDVEKLIELTNPGVYAELEELKEREERARRGDLSPEERLVVMQEALYPVLVATEERAASGALDARSGLCLLATLLLPCAMVAYGASFEGSNGLYLMYGAAGVAALCLLATIHALWTRMPRFIRRTQGEAIQRILKPYHPSPAELGQLRADLRAAGTALGKNISAAWLTDLFHSAEALSGMPAGAR